MKNQKGLSLIGLLLGGAVVIAVAIVVMKVVPSVAEYFTILKNVKAVANKSDPGSSVSNIRNAYETTTEVDATPSIAPGDLEISKDGNEVVISFAYSKKIPLGGNVSLMIDFEGSSASNKRSAAD